MGKPDRARQELEDLLPIAQRMFGETPRTMSVLTHLGDVVRDLNQPEKATAYYLAARGTIDPKRDQYDDAEISYRLGMMALAEGRSAEAAPLFQHTIDFQEKLRGGMQHPVAAYGHLGMALIHAPSSADSHRELESAERIVRQLPADTAMVVDRIASFGHTFQQAGKDDLAEILYRETLKYHDSQSQHRSAMVGLLQFAFKQFQLAPSDGYSIGRANLGLGQCLLTKGQGDEARPHLQRAAEIFEDQLGGEDPRTLEVRRLLATP
jgi:tetratricopeptide (TPR) repeat protein